jgi:hypothetical protein
LGKFWGPASWVGIPFEIVGFEGGFGAQLASTAPRRKQAARSPTTRRRLNQVKSQSQARGSKSGLSTFQLGGPGVPGNLGYNRDPGHTRGPRMSPRSPPPSQRPKVYLGSPGIPGVPGAVAQGGAPSQRKQATRGPTTQRHTRQVPVDGPRLQS